MAVDTKFINQLEKQIAILEGLEAVVKKAIGNAKDKVLLLRAGVPKEDERIFPPKK